MTAEPTKTSKRWRLVRNLAVAAAVPLLGVGMLQTASGAPEQPVIIPAPDMSFTESGSTAKVVLAGGCFWGVQGVFQRVEGVKNAVSGYAGGDASTAKYDLVTTGTTGHAEAVEITYDPNVVSLGELLHVFFSVAHNPTQLNYQGPDRGTQYRTAVFYDGAAEKAYVEGYISELDAAGVFPAKIVTTLEPLKAFYEAEDYHQDFLTENPTWPYIVYHDLPKIEALKTIFPDVYMDDPILVSEAR